MSVLDTIILNGVSYEIGGTGSGLTNDVKASLDQLAQKVAYIDDDGSDYYNALHSALYPPANLAYITCVYTQSGIVYTTDSLDSLKSDLVVTAHYTDSSSEIVTTYTLSGTLTTGTSTITVSYGGKTTTFTVSVTSLGIGAYPSFTDRAGSNGDYSLVKKTGATRTLLAMNGGTHPYAYTSDSTDTSLTLYPIPIGSAQSITITNTANCNYVLQVLHYNDSSGTWKRDYTSDWIASGTAIDTSDYSDGTYYYSCLLYNNNMSMDAVTITTT